MDYALIKMGAWFEIKFMKAKPRYVYPKTNEKKFENRFIAAQFSGRDKSI